MLEISDVPLEFPDALPEIPEALADFGDLGGGCDVEALHDPLGQTRGLPLERGQDARAARLEPAAALRD